MDTAKSRSLWLAILLGALLILPTQSFAQIYVGAYGGGVFPHEADAELEAIFGIPTPGLTQSGIEFETGVMFGGRVGYWLEYFNMPYLGVEGEFYWSIPHNGDQDVTLGAAVSANIPIQDTDFRVGTIGMNLLARYPYGPIQPYGGVGLAIIFADIDDIKLANPVPKKIIDEDADGAFPAGTTFLRGNDDTAVGLQLMGGVRWFVTDNIGVFAEYKWVIAELDFGEFEMDHNASHIYGGVEWHFGTGGVHQ